ncbi:endonuclease/exonuclease/phosphatase family protein [Oryzibacter oryziterrae]|uniref:endonuclease/exonuclease/phosphatase family protein n=1 Tax=Oryzibacter oryziterrae TaxID=2766474 RepID=UPI001F3F2B33|nr:endonuclease/exonuclease/phosphatase family protein [Oryzibacter oryziterrae]
MSSKTARIQTLISRVQKIGLRSTKVAAQEQTLVCDGQRHFRVASYNIHKCIGTDGVYDPARTAAVIAELDADFVALQEADRRFGSRDGRLNLGQLERETGLQLVPLAVRPTSHGWHGNALFARRGLLRRVERIALPHAEPRGAVLAEFDINGQSLRIIAAHLGLLSHWRRQQLQALRVAASSGPAMPTLLVGDFNEWRPRRNDSPLDRLQPFFGPADRHHPSFPSRRPIFPLDRIFGSPNGLIQHFEVHESPLARLASDHLPVKAVIDLAASSSS